MQLTNFQPLKSRWPQLYEFASLAEGYAFSDPHTATIKLRCFAETLVGHLYRELNLPSEPTDGFFEKLKSEIFQELVGVEVIQKLHAIRIFGNKAAHGCNVKTVDALSLIKEAYLIGKWLHKTYSDELHQEYPPHRDPVSPTKHFEELSQVAVHLAKQLADAKEELARLELCEKTAQQEIAALNQSLDKAKLQTFRNSSTEAARTIDFEVENTQRLISIHDAYVEYTLNDGQTELVNRLNQFLSNNEKSVFLLKGYAGTGKTFIIKGLTEYFRAIGRNYVLAAPTGKASKVIAKKTRSPAYTIHKTIYSFKNIAEYRDDDLDGSETYKFYAELAVNGLSADTVYIADEASMISDVYQEAEFFRFGSGFLLRDFLKFINLDHNDHSKKVIFIGDDAQLPPVGMNFSPALNADYLLREHCVKSTGFELTEVVRQKAESGVIGNSIQLRKALQAGVFNELDIDLHYPDVEKLDHQDLMPRYLESCDRKINSESIVIAHSNSDVADYNRCIREYFFPGCMNVTRGDKVMAVANSDVYGFFISNGDFGLIRQILGTTERRLLKLRRKNPDTKEVEEVSVPLSFRDVEIGFKDLDGSTRFFQAKIFEDLLNSEHPGLSSDQSKALYLDFCIRNKTLRRGSLEFKNALRSDPYFNALRLKFGYAITCHKAQGSEWNNVFVKCKTHQSQLTADYFRWFYTAITRTAKMLYLLDPPHLKIGSGIKIVQIPIIGLSEQQIKGEIHPAPEQVVNASSLEGEITNNTELNTFDIPKSGALLLAILNMVRDLLSGKAIVIDGITHNQYQEAYFFNNGNEFARVDISYNSKGKVTGLSVPQVSDFSAELVDLLAPLKGNPVVAFASTLPDQFTFEQEFLNDFHERLISKATEREIAIQNVTQQQWCQRYTFTKDSQIAVYDVFYNGKHQFKKCAPVITACSPGTLIGEVGVLLTEGMSV